MARSRGGPDRAPRRREALRPRAERIRAGSACARAPPVRRAPQVQRRRSPPCGASARRIRAPRRFSCTCCSRTRRWWCARKACRSRRSRISWRKSKACSGPAVYSSNMPDELEFERPLLELENRIAELRASDDTQAARDEIVRLDARLEGDPVVVIGHQKGRDTRENIARNFGMPHPEGYRKALRLMEMAAKFRKPLITFIDTPGAYPGLGAEERGQAEAIARNLREMAGLAIPIVCVVTGEGGSGGALAIGVANRVLMLEHAIYSVISPEGCAAILWGEAAKASEAAELMRITAPDLLKLGIIDGIVPEPIGGAHRSWEETAENLRGPLRDALWELRSRTTEELVGERYEKFRKIGVFQESA